MWFSFCLFSGRLISKNVHAGREEVLVEEHQNDDHHRRDCANRRHPHHPLCHEYYLKKKKNLHSLNQLGTERNQATPTNKQTFLMSLIISRSKILT